MTHTHSLSRVLASAGKDLKGSVFLETLSEREEANRNGKITVSTSKIRFIVCVCVCGCVRGRGVVICYALVLVSF